MVEVCAVAKRDLKAGEMLDDYGMYMTYGEAVNVDEMSAGRYLPEGLVEGCKLRRDITKDCRPHLRRRRAAAGPPGRPVAGRAIPQVPQRDLARGARPRAGVTRASMMDPKQRATASQQRAP